MTTQPQLVRGALLKCLFPFEDKPDLPGKSPHYCLLVESYEHEGKTFLIVAYGTSKLDAALQRAHPVLDIPTNLLSGSAIDANQGVIHILCDHLAIIPFDSKWVYMNFSARLGVFKPEHAMQPARRNLRERFERAEPVIRAAAISLLREFLATRKVGLKPGARLR
ncbi:hypothetical protein RQP54_17995 [Curvibacter sp. APW13]|uniref:hypothetical protein n=1 Tax=Curvibacter sp. APW13 TaxID=3077236 RepID=UPI0028E02080|nr:hypothetical protein [Curvibacter sp. APW13]MDT8992770.1 hypothetical protein [Curvibacter sp. APW13]